MDLSNRINQSLIDRLMEFENYKKKEGRTLFLKKKGERDTTPKRKSRDEHLKFFMLVLQAPPPIFGPFGFNTVGDLRERDAAK